MLTISLLQILILSLITVLQVQSSCTSVRSECENKRKDCRKKLIKFESKCKVKIINVFNYYLDHK